MNNLLIPQQARTFSRSLSIFWLNLKAGFAQTLISLFTLERIDVFIPSDTALLPDQKSYFDIVPAEECRDKMIARWRLLETLSEKRGGQLFLFISPDKENWTRLLLENCGINAVVLPVKR